MMRLQNRKQEKEEEDMMEIKGHQIGTGRPLICIPVMEKTVEETVKKIVELSTRRAEMIEWRLDAFELYADYNAVREVYENVAAHLGNTIFLQTFRTQQSGEKKEVPAGLTEDLGDLAVESGCVDLLDVEYFEEKRPAHRIKRLHQKGMKVVASHHDFAETPKPEVMQMLLEQMCAGDADIVKLAVMPVQEKDVLDLLAVTDCFRKEYPKTPVITMSMGKLGIASRICGESFGSAVTFASDGRASAPGQFDAAEMEQILKMIHTRLQVSEE